MARTSQSDPLQINEIEMAATEGRIGVTLCPGKKDPGAWSGPWDRDLDADLDVVKAWDAAAVVTLVESHEIESLRVRSLGEGVRARHMDWLHLPIVDGSIPDEGFEGRWGGVGEGLRARLRNGAKVLIHCKGGLGRAGTIAARLLVELGDDPERAMNRVREARKGAIENAGQEAFIRALEPVDELRPATDLSSARDRAIGALVGLAIGDAVGTSLEFSPRDDLAARLTDMVGGGPFSLEPGQWTDDTSMALALADSLRISDAFDPADLMTRFVRWWRKGDYSSNGRCFDIGITTREALERFLRSGDPIAGSTSPTKAGNGSLMRLAPVAIRYWPDENARRRVAALQSATTHGAPEAIDACMAFTDILSDAIAGRPRSEVLRSRQGPYRGRIGDIVGGGWRGQSRERVRASGYVAHSLEAALWCVGRTSNFRDAVLLAANLREDADTTAAITGQLAGAIYGRLGIDPEWLGRLHGGQEIAEVAGDLFEKGAATAAGDEMSTTGLCAAAGEWRGK